MLPVSFFVELAAYFVAIAPPFLAARGLASAVDRPRPHSFGAALARAIPWLTGGALIGALAGIVGFLLARAADRALPSWIAEFLMATGAIAGAVYAAVVSTAEAEDVRLGAEPAGAMPPDRVAPEPAPAARLSWRGLEYRARFGFVNGGVTSFVVFLGFLIVFATRWLPPLGLVLAALSMVTLLAAGVGAVAALLMVRELTLDHRLAAAFGLPPARAARLLVAPAWASADAFLVAGVLSSIPHSAFSDRFIALVLAFLPVFLAARIAAAEPARWRPRSVTATLARSGLWLAAGALAGLAGGLIGTRISPPADEHFLSDDQYIWMLAAVAGGIYAAIAVGNRAIAAGDFPRASDRGGS
jgi:hypothetical protein